MTTTAAKQDTEASTSTKKVRVRKPQTAEHFMTSIKGQPLTVKVDLIKHLKASIDNDRKVLQEQLALIEPLK